MRIESNLHISPASTDLVPAASGRLALLLQNTAEFPSMSMKRYAVSLAAALAATPDAGWRAEMPLTYEPAWLAGVAGRTNASRWGRLVRYPRRVRQLRRELRPAVCHVLDQSHANLLVACDSDTSIITVHDLIPMLAAVGELDVPISRTVGATFRLKLRRIARCRRVIVDSESTKRHLIRFTGLSADRVVAIYPGVSDTFAPSVNAAADQTVERAAILRRYGIDPIRRVVLHVCTPMRYKNSPALLHAIASLPADVVLLRVGAPLFADERMLADALGVTRRVFNAGPVPTDADLAAHYRAADVMAFPSIFEGFGWPPIEAMKCGTPAVISNAASLPEAGGNAALYAAPDDHAGLAAAIDRLLGDSVEYACRRAAGLAHAAAFTWERCAREVAAVYDAVVGVASYPTKGD